VRRSRAAIASEALAGIVRSFRNRGLSAMRTKSPKRRIAPRISVARVVHAAPRKL
jgi:hypothetical protein